MEDPIEFIHWSDDVVIDIYGRYVWKFIDKLGLW